MLVVSELRRSFGGVEAVTGASFQVPEGRITGLIGPNSAGKSTVVGLIGGALKPDSGSITFDGVEIGGWPPHRVAHCGILRTFQLASEFGRLTVLENLMTAVQDHPGEAFVAPLLGKWYWSRVEVANVERARTLLQRFGMSAAEDEYAGNLSGGQKRLLEIMRGLMARPKLLLLDEPMAGVNPSLARELERYLIELRDEGLTMLLVEHELGRVERLCDPVVVMAQGRVIAEGPVGRVLSEQQVTDAYLIG